MQTTPLTAWQAARRSYSLFFANLPRFGLTLLKLLAMFILTNGLVLTFFYEAPEPIASGASGAAHLDAGANLDLLAFLLTAPFLAACGRLALLGEAPDGSFFANFLRKREARFLFTMLGATIAGLAPIGLAAMAVVMLVGPDAVPASPDSALVLGAALIALFGLILSSVVFFRAQVWALAAAADKQTPFKKAFSLGGRTVKRAFAATALVSGPFLVLNALIGMAAFAWIGGDPAVLHDKRLLFFMDVSTSLIQALHMGLMTLACGLIAKSAIPELFDDAPDVPQKSPQPAPGETP